MVTNEQIMLSSVILNNSLEQILETWHASPLCSELPNVLEICKILPTHEKSGGKLGKIAHKLFVLSMSI